MSTSVGDYELPLEYERIGDQSAWDAYVRMTDADFEADTTSPVGSAHIDVVTPEQETTLPLAPDATTAEQYTRGWWKPVAVFLGIAALAGGAGVKLVTDNQPSASYSHEVVHRNPFKPKDPACAGDSVTETFGPMACIDVHKSTEQTQFATTLENLLGSIDDYRSHLDTQTVYQGTGDYQVHQEITASGFYALTITNREYDDQFGDTNTSLRLDVNGAGHTQATYHRVVTPLHPGSGVAFKETDIVVTPSSVHVTKVTDIDGNPSTTGDRYQSDWQATRVRVGGVDVSDIENGGEAPITFTMSGASSIGQSALVEVNKFLQNGISNTVRPEVEMVS